MNSVVVLDTSEQAFRDTTQGRLYHVEKKEHKTNGEFISFFDDVGDTVRMTIKYTRHMVMFI